MPEIAPLSKRPAKMGIITQRRLPPQRVVARQPVPRAPPKAEKAPKSWDEIQRLNQARWHCNLGVKLAAANAAAYGQPFEGADALDMHLVEIQKQRHARLDNIRRGQNMPIVKRLLGPPPAPPRPVDPLDVFMEFVSNQAAAGGPQVGTKAHFARPDRALLAEPGMPTKMGLYYARKGY